MDKKFNIQINGSLYGVYRREEKHNIGSLNGSPYEDNLWVKYFDNDINNIIWVPWHSWGGNNRTCFEIKIKQDNRLKYKWSEYSIRNSDVCEIFCNTRKVYEFRFNDLNYAFACAQKMVVEMSEHFFNFRNPEKEIGRKIWYKRQPAIISKLLLDQGCIFVEKDGEGGFSMKEPWHTSEDDYMFEEWEGEKEIKTDVFDSDIYWFRKD